jgi:hypothetical protein
MDGWDEGAQNEGPQRTEDDWIALCCPFTLTIAGHTMRCQMEKGHHLRSEHSFSIDWEHDQSDQK